MATTPTRCCRVRPCKKVYEIAIGSGTTDVTGIDLDAPGASFTKVVKNPTAFIDLAANTLDALGNLVPEKWGGLTIGPKLADGSHVIVAGTDNDYSVTQNAGGTQFDIYTNNAGTRVQCALGVACAPAGYFLIPGVLHAYKASALELANYAAPVPEPSTWAMLAAGMLGRGAASAALFLSIGRARTI